MSEESSRKSGPHWLVAAVLGAIVALPFAWFGLEDFRLFPSDQRGEASAPNEAPADGLDVVRNLGLGLGPPSIKSDGSEFTEISVTGATPGATLDLEIRQPSYIEGGVCSRIDPTTPCNLVYGGGGLADPEGEFNLKFPNAVDVELYSGLYQVTVRDQHTGVTVEIDLSVE